MRHALAAVVLALVAAGKPAAPAYLDAAEKACDEASRALTERDVARTVDRCYGALENAAKAEKAWTSGHKRHEAATQQRVERRLRYVRSACQCYTATALGDASAADALPRLEPFLEEGGGCSVEDQHRRLRCQACYADAGLALATTRYDTADYRGAESAADWTLRASMEQDQADGAELRAKVLALQERARRRVPPVVAPAKAGAGTVILAGYVFTLPAWWDSIEVDPPGASTEAEGRLWADMVFGSDMGTEATWRQALKTWVLVYQKSGELPVYVGHAYAVGGQHLEAARVYAGLAQLAPKQGKHADWFNCYLSYHAGRELLAAGDPASADAWLRVAASYAIPANDTRANDYDPPVFAASKRFIGKEAERLLAGRADEDARDSATDPP